MTAHRSPIVNYRYFVVAIDYGRKGIEAIVDPELTYQNIVGRVASHEYDPERILFIHHIDKTGVEDVTDAILEDAGVKAVA